MCADRVQAGQALVETLVGAVVLVPLAVLVIWLGKVMTIDQATVAASRILAFECAARPDDCARAAEHPELVEELRRRAFSRLDAPVLTAERLGDAPSTSERNPLWTDRANRPLLQRFSDVGARVDAEHFDAGVSLAGSRGGAAASNALELVTTLAGPGRFGLAIDGGLVAARVQANVSASPGAISFARQLDSIALRMKAQTAVLTDAWTAIGPYGGDDRSVESRVERGQRLPQLLETAIDARYRPTLALIDVMGAVGLEPEAGAFRYHAIDVDVVPPDRLDGSVPAYPPPGTPPGGPSGW